VKYRVEKSTYRPASMGLVLRVCMVSLRYRSVSMALYKWAHRSASMALYRSASMALYSLASMAYRSASMALYKWGLLARLLPAAWLQIRL